MKAVNRWIILIVGMTGTGKSSLVEKLISNERRVLIYDPNLEYEADRFIHIGSMGSFRVHSTDFIWACDTAFRAGRCTLVLDDAGSFLQEPIAEELETVIRRGRHREVNIIVTTHRLPDLAPVARAQTDLIVSFQAVLPYDLQMLVPYGFNPDEIKTLAQPKRAPWIGDFRYIALTNKGIEKMVLPFKPGNQQ